MSQIDSTLLPALLVSIQVLGLLSACLARANRDAPRQQFFASLFMLALVAVGGSVITAGLQRQPAAWLFGGASMGLMVLVTVWEHSTKSEEFSGP